MEDSELIGRAAGGDEVAFELLVRRHVDAAWRLARTLLGDDFAAEEAVQDTFWKAYGALAGFRGDSSVRTWVLAICRRVCLDRLRLKRAEVVPLDELRARAGGDDALFRLALEEAMSTLPAEEREAFTLVDILGYSREEAAGILGAPASTVRSRVTRARKRLADQLDERTAIAGGK